MKKTILLVLAVILALSAFSCKSKAKSKLPDRGNKVSAYATIPSFKVLFLGLQNMATAGSALPTDLSELPPRKDSLKTAFCWGKLAASAQMAVRARDYTRCQDIASNLSQISPGLGLTDVTDRLAGSLRSLLANEDWDTLESTFFNMQYTVEQRLLVNRQYELYTMAALGGWTEATYQIAGLVAEDYRTGDAGLLLQREAWMSLADNLALFPPARYGANKSFLAALHATRQMQALMDRQSQGTFTPELVEQLRDTAIQLLNSLLIMAA